MSEMHPLRAWRKAEGVTLAALASQVGVVPSYLSEIERRQRQPSLPLAIRLASFAKCDVAEFMRSRGGERAEAGEPAPEGA